MKRLISIIPLLILTLVFSFACTTMGQESKATEGKPDYNLKSLMAQVTVASHGVQINR